MHDINLIYSQYMVDRISEERREEATARRRGDDMATRTSLMARVIALLRWQRTRVDVTEPRIEVTPTVEGASS